MPKRRAQGDWLLLAGVGVAGLVIGYLIGAAAGPGASAVVEPTVADSAVAESGDAPPARAPVLPSVEPEPAVVVEPPGLAEGAARPPGVAGGPYEESLPSEASPPLPVDLGPPPPGGGARVALVIDDLGRRVEDVVELSALGVPMSFAVLPFEVRTAEVVAELERRGAEVLLHLPMEARNGANPGPGALTREMSPAELEAHTRWALQAVAPATGVNNHMGSGLSGDEQTMRTVLGVLAERDLFYLDSRTSADSVGYRTARELGLAALERQVFLDAEVRPDAIRFQFRRLLDEARRRGSAVAIGHPHRDTIAVLEQVVPEARAAGYVFVPVSSLLAGGPLAAR